MTWTNQGVLPICMYRAANKVVYSTSFLNEVREASGPIVSPSYYQQLGLRVIDGISTQRRFVDLGDKLIGLAEQAYAFRQSDQLRDLSQALLSLPLPRQYRAAARYFRGLELIRRGDLEGARIVLESVAAEPSHRYTARAIQSLGAIFKIRGELDSSLKLHIEAGQAAGGRRNDMLTAVFVRRNIAVLKSMGGDHRGALVELERMYAPMKTLGAIHPQAYYDYLNSLAVELAEAGRLEEAAQASRIVVSTPFVFAYPEWRETFGEIVIKKRQRASRSAVAVRDDVGSDSVKEIARETKTLVSLRSAQQRTSGPEVDKRKQSTRARVIDFQQWKTMLKASSQATPLGVAAGMRGRMTTGEKLIRLMDLISQDETDDETIDSILETVEQIVTTRRSQNRD